VSINPIAATKLISESYFSYLTTTFKLQNESLQNQFRANLTEKSRFIKGPILEATPEFEKGKNILELIDEGIIPQAFLRLNNDGMPGVEIREQLYLDDVKSFVMYLCFAVPFLVIAPTTSE
jgi:ATP-dependent helicase YprA (DUF1998 family)